jgi:transcriptional regulator with XRE-family HTH domain
VPDFGKRLRKLRLAARLTQQELAERAGLAESAVVQLETDSHVPTWSETAQLAGALHVQVDTFVDRPVASEKRT